METLGTVCRGSSGHTKDVKGVSWVLLCLALGWCTAKLYSIASRMGDVSLLALQSSLYRSNLM